MALIICGVPRSGTTMLQRLCVGHPELAITRESRIFAFPPAPFSRHARQMLGNTWRRAWGGWWSGYRRDVAARLWFAVRYVNALRGVPHATVVTETREQALRRLFPAATIVGDKYPGYVFDLERHTADPHLSCLVIYRDGRDVTSSTLRAVRTVWKNRAFTVNIDSVEKAARRWVHGIDLMRRYRDRLHVVRYEDLVSDPARVMNEVARWLDVDPAGFRVKQVRRTSVGKHRSGLTPDELATVMDVAGPTLAELGYS